ncbi:EAL domain-containing response regulator [Shewanella atlantica]|uniref:EAL domain-containing protein n=1 Tax=Shewanella atlantica TaxID=271099 RepID=A0A431WHD1_9GAMM|nr:EAL domain-containing response regulator [Shewanella atlantica]RTR34811.1 EAL domain-containing protein [Shewanella atlantica]
MTINVLIIDDSLSSCRVLSKHFMQLNVDRIEYCSDGQTALRTLTKYKGDYQVIVVDLHMPKMDGIELLIRLSKIGFKGGVIIASGMESRIIEAASQVVVNSRLRLLGALMKPVCASQLKICIERLYMMDVQLVPNKPMMEVKELQEAINCDKVIPYYQAQMDVKTGEIKGFEVLCRIQQGDQLQLISPSRFIDLAEENNLLNTLTDKLITRAMDEWREISRVSACLGSSISINLTPNQLAQRSWPNRLMRYCEDKQLEPSKVTIEITENQVLDKQSQHSSISRLRLHNFGVAIDDFGTGYTNLSQLCKLPISEVKLDMSLVKGIHLDPLAQTILKSLQDISQGLGVDLVAEGVEDIRDLNYLEKIDDLRLQGYLICRPKPFSEIMRWLKAHEKVGCGLV